MRGVLLCLVSAASFATLGVFGELATDAGASLSTLLLVRFAAAAALFFAAIDRMDVSLVSLLLCTYPRS